MPSIMPVFLDCHPITQSVVDCNVLVNCISQTLAREHKRVEICGRSVAADVADDLGLQ